MFLLQVGAEGYVRHRSAVTRSANKERGAVGREDPIDRRMLDAGVRNLVVPTVHKVYPVTVLHLRLRGRRRLCAVRCHNPIGGFESVDGRQTRILER